MRAQQLWIHAWRIIWQQFMGDVNGENKTEALKIEAAEDLDVSSKPSFRSGEMELEGLRVHLSVLSFFFFFVKVILCFLFCSV